jgi:uncharacterized repeat protein (TIGR01451 family)
MIASVFAAIAPSTTADVKAASNFQTAKETMNAAWTAIDPAMTYKVGDTARYIVNYTNTDPTFNCTLTLTDLLPDGTTYTFGTDVFFAVGQERVYYYNYTIKAGDVRAAGLDGVGYDHISNYARTDGLNENSEPITDNRGKFSRITYDLPPSFNFTWEAIGCLEVEFNPTWNASGTTIVNHTWNFGDGSTPVTIVGPPVPITHNYSTCSFKTVTLSGWAANGLSGSDTDVIYVDCGPTAIAKADPTCFESAGSLITFDGSASHADPLNTLYPQSIASYLWEFDDGYPDSTDAVTTRTVNDTVTATLTVVDTLGCEDTDNVTVGPCSLCNIRIYGTYDHGAGKIPAEDPLYPGYQPENAPYSDPLGPFYPQSKEAPRKDFITFNPAIMDHNEGYDELNYVTCNGTIVQTPAEKVFKRMWYEKEWFKDSNMNGEWDIVTNKGVMNWSTWLAYPQWDRPVIKEWNNPSLFDGSPDPDYKANADIYGPAIIQEFTYMTIDSTVFATGMPLIVQAGSKILIPMAHDPADPYRGLNSFDANGDGVRDSVRVESEKTLDLDIDMDGVLEPMDPDLIELNGNESVVFVLYDGQRFGDPRLTVGQSLQFFDHVVTLDAVDEANGNAWAWFRIEDNEGGGSTRGSTVDLQPGQAKFFYRGVVKTAPATGEKPAFYVRLISADKLTNSAVFEVGRMFGQTYANIEVNQYRAQKMMIVDEVFYNVVAIKAQDDCFKYITIRQKLPKTPIKIFGKELKTWATFEVLPEMSPYNQNHEIIEDIYPIDPEDPPYPIEKFGPKKPMPPLEIRYVDESIEKRYKGELKEIYNETEPESLVSEYWNLEWFWTKPWQYTEFRLPKNDRYLVTLSWLAPESDMTLWDHQPQEPVANWTGERFKFWYEDCTGPLYIDRATGSIRIYGTFGEGAGDQTATDVEPGPSYGYEPENKPYTDPRGPFYPQHEQAPKKDFMTFNPAVMDHNEGYPELDYIQCPGYIVQTPAEKVFKRMWYEKEWFKDLISSNTHGEWDVVIEHFDGSKWVFKEVMTLAEWNAIPDWVKITGQLRIKQSNNPSLPNGSPDPDFKPQADIYGPAIVQEFTYMTIDSTEYATGMPLMVQAGSKILLPLAHYDGTPYRGLNSFDADGNQVRDAVRVESEQTLGIDIDLDGVQEPMDKDSKELNGNEQVVFVLGPKKLTTGTTLQFFDHVVTLESVSVMGNTYSVQIHVEDNEGIGARGSTVDMDMGVNQVKRFYRGVVKNAASAEQPAFYVKLLSADHASQTARIEVGRMFGQTHANIEFNPYRAQKMMIVDQVFYNIVAVKAQDNCFKFITIRQKLPKVPIKIFGFELKYWLPGETLPELSPFNENHEILVDVQAGWGAKPVSQADKIGPKIPRPPLNITYVKEDEEWRFLGELKEIYNETWNPSTGIEDEYWNVEWFHTQPKQYTAFVVPDGELYLMTLAWFAPQAETTLWDHQPDGPVGYWTGERVKFWYDPMDDTDIYINRVGDMPPAGEPTIADYYNMIPNHGDGYPYISTDEVIHAVMDYLTDAGPFAPGADPAFTKADLLDYIMQYLAQ